MEGRHKAVMYLCVNTQRPETLGPQHCSFCFACISQWANIESRCPMCKLRFKTLRHKRLTSPRKRRRWFPGTPLPGKVLEEISVPERNQVGLSRDWCVSARVVSPLFPTISFACIVLLARKWYLRILRSRLGSMAYTASNVEVATTKTSCSSVMNATRPGTLTVSAWTPCLRASGFVPGASLHGAVRQPSHADDFVGQANCRQHLWWMKRRKRKGRDGAHIVVIA